MSAAATPPGKPTIGCRLNINHTWRMEYPPERAKYGWCVKCGKVNPTWSGRKWSDIFWIGYKPASEQKNYWGEWFEETTGVGWGGDEVDGRGRGRDDANRPGSGDGSDS